MCRVAVELRQPEHTFLEGDPSWKTILPPPKLAPAGRSPPGSSRAATPPSKHIVRTKDSMRLLVTLSLSAWHLLHRVPLTQGCPWLGTQMVETGINGEEKGIRMGTEKAGLIGKNPSDHRVLSKKWFYQFKIQFSGSLGGSVS